MIENSITGTIPEFADLIGNTFRTPQNAGGKNVLETLPSIQKQEQVNNLRITTIHGIKGETLDAVLLVSAPSKRGTPDGQWTQWLEDSKTEAARLAYVASSRPGHLLAWAIPKPIGNREEDIIRELGFLIVEMTE